MLVRVQPWQPISGRQADISWLHLSRKQDRHRRGRSITDAFRHRPVAQKQSTRLITGRRRSVTCRDDQPSLSELRLGRPIWNVNRTSEPGLGANESVPLGKWCKSTTFRQTLQAAHGGRAQAPACSSKRTGGFITRIALDECRARERYPARRPFYISERASLERPRSAGTKPVIETGRRCLLV